MVNRSVSISLICHLQVFGMPAVIVELELPRLPQAWEDGLDLVLARMRRLKRRMRIRLARRMAVVRSGFRDWMEGLRPEDEEPIIRRGEV